MKRLSSRKASAPDYVFLGVVAFLVVFGLVMLTSASSDLAAARFGNSYYYLTHQLLFGLLPGLIGFCVGFFVYYRHWERWATVILIASIVLLILVFTPLGHAEKGATRWLSIGSFTFQPSELLKLTFFIYLASWISRNEARRKSFSEGFLPFMLLVVGVVVLLIVQPATTVAILIFAASLGMYFTAGGRFSFIVVAVLIAGLGISLLIAVTPYRMQRILTFLHPNSDTQASGYQITQAQNAIGSGRLLGVGFGKSTTKLKYLPEPIGDSIFAVIAEELGFVGATAVVLAFLFLVLRGLRIARGAPDEFSRLLVTSFTVVLGLQAFVNMGAISGIIPLTGVPLPFVSYGGTALAVFLTMCGVIANISRHSRKI